MPDRAVPYRKVAPRPLYRWSIAIGGNLQAILPGLVLATGMTLLVCVMTQAWFPSTAGVPARIWPSAIELPLSGALDLMLITIICSCTAGLESDKSSRGMLRAINWQRLMSYSVVILAALFGVGLITSSIATYVGFLPTQASLAQTMAFVLCGCYLVQGALSIPYGIHRSSYVAPDCGDSSMASEALQENGIKISTLQVTAMLSGLTINALPGAPLVQALALLYVIALITIEAVAFQDIFYPVISSRQGHA